jgi:hypothetical protein
MTSAPAKDKERQKEKKDNIFFEILYNIVVQIPVFIITWFISKLDWD